MIFGPTDLFVQYFEDIAKRSFPKCRLQDKFNSSFLFSEMKILIVAFPLVHKWPLFFINCCDFRNQLMIFFFVRSDSLFLFYLILKSQVSTCAKKNFSSYFCWRHVDQTFLRPLLPQITSSYLHKTVEFFSISGFCRFVNSKLTTHIQNSVSFTHFDKSFVTYFLSSRKLSYLLRLCLSISAHNV